MVLVQLITDGSGLENGILVSFLKLTTWCQVDLRLLRPLVLGTETLSPTQVEACR